MTAPHHNKNNNNRVVDPDRSNLGHKFVPVRENLANLSSPSCYVPLSGGAAHAGDRKTDSRPQAGCAGIHESARSLR